MCNTLSRPIRETPLEDAGLRLYTTRLLLRAGFITLGEAADVHADDPNRLLAIYGFGPVCLADLEAAIADLERGR